MSCPAALHVQRRVSGAVALAAVTAARCVASSSGRAQHAQAAVELIRQSGIAPAGSLQAAAHKVVQEYAKAGDLKGVRGARLLAWTAALICTATLLRRVAASSTEHPI